MQVIFVCGPMFCLFPIVSTVTSPVDLRVSLAILTSFIVSPVGFPRLFHSSKMTDDDNVLLHSPMSFF